MRRFVNRQGLMLSLAALAALLSEEAARAVPLPAAVADRTVGIVAGGLSRPTVTSLYLGVLHTMKMTKIAVALGGLALSGTIGGILWAQAAPKPQTPQQMLGRVRSHYQGLSSFSMRVEHQGERGPFSGRYTQVLQWRRGGRFILRVTSHDRPNASDFIADGRQVADSVNGRPMTASLTIPPNDVPRWESSGGEIMGWLQDTPRSHWYFSPRPGMTITWTFGPRTVWHGMKVRELRAHVSDQGHVGTMSLFLNPNGTLLLGHEGGTTDGKPGYALFLNQKENPLMPATLGTAP